jgi:hypothetical protein
MVHWGITRAVVLIGGYAIKIPSWRHGLRMFRCGMTSNKIEYLLYQRFTLWQFSEAEKMCPSIWCAPWGLLQVQRRVKPLDRDIRPCEECHLWKWSTDHKPENYGLLDGKVVCVDYA